MDGCVAGADGLRGLVECLETVGQIRAAIESMSGARFVHERLDELGWEVEIADAQKVKGLAPSACKTDWIWTTGPTLPPDLLRAQTRQWRDEHHLNRPPTPRPLT